MHLVFAGEKVRDSYVSAAPAVDESERTSDFNVVSLEALVQMKLVSYRDRDKTHLRDMLDVGLIDATWCTRFPAILSDRLQVLVDNPDG